MATATITRLKAGETPHVYDMGDPVQKAEAEKEFGDLISQEWKAYDSTGEPVSTLQPEGETLMQQRINGG
jgi:hypothetical protein